MSNKEKKENKLHFLTDSRDLVNMREAIHDPFVTFPPKPNLTQLVAYAQLRGRAITSTSPLPERSRCTQPAFVLWSGGATARLKPSPERFAENHVTCDINRRNSIP